MEGVGDGAAVGTAVFVGVAAGVACKAPHPAMLTIRINDRAIRTKRLIFIVPSFRETEQVVNELILTVR
jgi:hypothetical protein